MSTQQASSSQSNLKVAYTPEERLIKARITMLRKYPFWGHLAMNLSFIEEKVPVISGLPKEVEEGLKMMITLGVDAKGNLYYNPDVIDTLSNDEVMGVLVHELHHLIYDHHRRRGIREQNRFNRATDYAINCSITHMGFKLPKWVLLDEKRFHEKVAEEIYEKLKDEKCPQGWSWCFRGSFGHGNIKDMDGVSGNKADNIDWKKKASEAYAYAKGRGTVPADIEDMIDIVLKPPRLRIQDLILKEIQSYVPVDFTWMRPSRRSVTLGVYLPSTIKETIEMVCALDTSGSMDEKILQNCLSEMMWLVKSTPQLNLTLITCDAQVTDVGKLTSDMTKVKIRGRGGTDFRPVFAWLEKNKPDIRLLLFFTDMDGTFPRKSDVNTLWITNNRSAIPPFGRVLRTFV